MTLRPIGRQSCPITSKAKTWWFHRATTSPWETTGWSLSTATIWGFVPRADIVGTPLFIYWSFIEPEDEYERSSLSDRLTFYGHVIIHFFDQTRWRRTFRVVR